jgi:hypothetical protein
LTCQNQSLGRQRSQTKAFFAVVGFAISQLSGPVSHASGLQCSGIPVSVHAHRASEGDTICRAANYVVRLLQSCGIEAKSALKIQIVQDLVANEGRAYGCFDRSTGVIQLLTLDRCAERLKADASRSGLDPTDYFRSIAVHEVAHGILAQQEGASELPLIAHEYLAYALQIDSMSPSSKQALLEPLHGRGRLSIELPHEILLMMNPVVFGAISYLHFKNSDQCGTIRSVLRGEVIFPRMVE